MKKILLLLSIPLGLIGMNKPSAVGRPGTPMPKLPPIIAAARKVNRQPPAHLLKMVTCGVNIWCNEQCDPERWAHMVELYRRLEDEPFNRKALVHTILEEIELSSDKKGNGIWGGLSFTYLTDSQKLDKENKDTDSEIDK